MKGIRTGLFGYRKSDVSKYLADVDFRYTKSLKETQKSHQKELEEREEKISMLEEKNKELEADLQNLLDEIIQVRNECKALKEENKKDGI